MTHAQTLAVKGYAALVFNFRGQGKSLDKIAHLEDPTRKTLDIHAAADYLVTRILSIP